MTPMYYTYIKGIFVYRENIYHDRQSFLNFLKRNLDVLEFPRSCVIRMIGKDFERKYRLNKLTGMLEVD